MQVQVYKSTLVPRRNASTLCTSKTWVTVSYDPNYVPVDLFGNPYPADRVRRVA